MGAVESGPVVADRTSLMAEPVMTARRRLLPHTPTDPAVNLTDATAPVPLRTMDAETGVGPTIRFTHARLPPRRRYASRYVAPMLSAVSAPYTVAACVRLVMSVGTVGPFSNPLGGQMNAVPVSDGEPVRIGAVLDATTVPGI
jgi:hypothetical protein